MNNDTLLGLLHNLWLSTGPVSIMYLLVQCYSLGKSCDFNRGLYESEVKERRKLEKFMEEKFLELESEKQ